MVDWQPGRAPSDSHPGVILVPPVWVGPPDALLTSGGSTGMRRLEKTEPSILLTYLLASMGWLRWSLSSYWGLPRGGAHLARNWGGHRVQQPARNRELGGRSCPSWAWRWLQSWETSWRLCRKHRLGDPAKPCLDFWPCRNWGMNKCVLISVTKFWSNLLCGN